MNCNLQLSIIFGIALCNYPVVVRCDCGTTINSVSQRYCARHAYPIAGPARRVPPQRAMNIAIPTLDDRVSPVFDVAQAMVLVDLDGDHERNRQTVPLHSQDLGRRVAELTQHGVDVLICGAISRPLEALLRAAAIEVIPQTCGAVEDVLRAFVAGRLNEPEFLMPGCCGRRRQGWCGNGGRRRRAGGRGRAARGGGARQGSRGSGRRHGLA